MYRLIAFTVFVMLFLPLSISEVQCENPEVIQIGFDHNGGQDPDCWIADCSLAFGDGKGTFYTPHEDQFDFCIDKSVEHLGFDPSTVTNIITTQIPKTGHCSIDQAGTYQSFEITFCPANSIHCHSDEECDDNDPQTNNICLNPGQTNSTCNNEPIEITCRQNIDCGQDGFILEPFCSESDIFQNFNIFTCNNPGQEDSFCTFDNSQILIESCSDFCVSGSCQDFRCTDNQQCNDNNQLTIDECLNPSTSTSFCRNTPIACNSNLDCGITSFLGLEFCSINDIFRNFRTFSCIDPGTINSSCSQETQPQLIQQCQFACSDGACISCDEDSDCNDNNQTTQDFCINPGLNTSHCTNNPNGVIACHTNEDCPLDEIDLFCSGNNLIQEKSTHICNNPGTSDSSCNVNITQEILETCDTCQNSQCISSDFSLTIISPQENQISNSRTIPLDFIVTGNPDSCSYILNNQESFSITNCQNTNFIAPEGNNHLIVFAQKGNETVQDSVNFEVTINETNKPSGGGTTLKSNFINLTSVSNTPSFLPSKNINEIPPEKIYLNNINSNKLTTNSRIINPFLFALIILSILLLALIIVVKISQM